MKRENLSSLQTLSILGGAAVMLSLAMGMRQSWGLFQPHMIRDIGITAADFSLAIAIQNMVWALTPSPSSARWPTGTAHIRWASPGCWSTAWASSAASMPPRP